MPGVKTKFTLTQVEAWLKKVSHERRGGETGRRTGLKIPRSLLHEGSIPSPGTILELDT